MESRDAKPESLCLGRRDALVTTSDLTSLRERRLELAARLADTQESISRACAGAGRGRDCVTLVVVTKTWPVSDIKTLTELGVRDIGENRDQEAAAKYAQIPDLALSWHFIGQLQTNKCHSVVRYADMVHSVDRPRLVSELDSAVTRAEREPLVCLVQVNLDPGDGDRRGGVQPASACELADQIAEAQGLVLGGVMGVAPLGGGASAAFDRLRDVAGTIADDHPSATIISAGMSGDFVAAINAGATHVRMGAAVLGHRDSLR